MHLLNNAAKNRPQRAYLATVERQGIMTVVTVKDDGIGIAEELLAKLFEKCREGKARLETPKEGWAMVLRSCGGLWTSRRFRPRSAVIGRARAHRAAPPTPRWIRRESHPSQGRQAEHLLDPARLELAPSLP